MRLAARRGIGQAGHDLGKFGNGSHPDFVPIEKCVHQGGEGLFGRLVTSVFQTTGEDQMLRDRPARIGRGGLVMFLENFINFSELCRATDCCHGKSSRRKGRG